MGKAKNILFDIDLSALLFETEECKKRIDTIAKELEQIGKNDSITSICVNICNSEGSRITITTK